PARDIRMVVRLEPREREEGRGPDRGPGPEEELGHRVPGPFEAQLPARGAALLHTFGRAHRRSDDTGLPDRIFTVPEAQATLADVRPLAERMVAARRELTEAGAKLEELRRVVAGNGGGLSTSDAQELQDRVDEAMAEIAGCVKAITELGVQVKDLDRGLVDFPSLRGGDEVLLCWHVGEDEIRYW